MLHHFWATDGQRSPKRYQGGAAEAEWVRSLLVRLGRGLSMSRQCREQVAHFFDPSVEAAMNAIAAQIREAPLPASVSYNRLYKLHSKSRNVSILVCLSGWWLLREPIPCFRVEGTASGEEYSCALSGWADVRRCV